MKNIFCSIIVLFLINNLANSQIKNKIILPFKIVKDRMILNLKTEKGTFNFLFDTGSNATIIDSVKAKELNLKFEFKSYDNKSIRYRTDFDLGKFIPKVKWITSFEKESKRINYPVDGLLGAFTLINNNNTLIDFRSGEIVIGADYNVSDSCQKSFDICSVNKATTGVGRYLPKMISIADTVQFDSILSKDVDLILDTGNKYGFAFYCSDSISINSLSLYVDDYMLFSETSETKNSYTLARGHNLDSAYYTAPLFYRPDDKNVLNNSFYGSLGIPLLKKFDKIFIDWNERKIFFINKSQK